MRRAVVLIPLNIAEGQGRNSTKEFINFFTVARGLQMKLETQLQICIQLNYITETQAEFALGLCQEVNKMLNVLILKLKSSI